MFSAWYNVALAEPEAFVNMLNLFVCSPIMISKYVVKAKLCGKVTAHPKPAEIRAILPLPALMQVADWLVADALATQLRSASLCRTIAIAVEGMAPRSPM